jgi:hypothetical protein
VLLVEVLAERRVPGECGLGGIVRCKFTLMDGEATRSRARDADTPGAGSRTNDSSLHEVSLLMIHA